MENKLTKKSLTTTDMVLIPMFSALISVGAFIKIPVQPVPVALQFIFCALAGLILGEKKGLMAVLLYLLIGLIGFPVFTMGGGPSYVLQPSFGYLVGMAVATYVIGLLSSKISTRNVLKMTVISFIGLMIVYTLGVIHLYLIRNFYLSKAMDLSKAIYFGAIVFILMDTVWCFAAANIAAIINKYTNDRYRR